MEINQKEILLTKNKLKTIRINNLLLHSKYDPIREARDIVKENFKVNALNVLFGFGIGYIYNEIKSLYGDDETIVIDPFYKVLKDHAIIEPKNIIDSIDKVKINRLVHKMLPFYSKNINVICSPNYQQLCMNEYKETLKILKNIQHSNIISENTIRFFGEIWQRNYIENLSLINRYSSFNELLNKHKEPIVIASGGPSLSKQIPLLKKYRSKCILIASGSTINSLLEEEICPDYIISVDGGEANFNHFKSIAVNTLRDAKLIFAFSSNYKIQQNFKNTMYAFLLNDDEKFQNYLYKEFDLIFPRLVGGTSVANFALSCAINMTEAPIAIIGQDLAYTNNYSHAKGNKNCEKMDEGLLIKKQAFKETGYYGQKVWTDSLFVAMREEFEKLYVVYEDEKEIYNCTEGGLKIERIPQKSFKDFCEEFLKDNINIEESKNEPPPHYPINLVLKNEIDKYKSLIIKLQKAVTLLEKEKLNNYFSDTLLKELDMVDEEVKKIQEETSINYIFEPILLDAVSKYETEIEESREKKFINAYKQNTELYKNLIKALKITIEIVNSCLVKEEK